MDIIRSVLFSVHDMYSHKMNILGFSISFWDVIIFGVIASIVFMIIRELMEM